MENKIDFVLTWVDGNDKNWQKEKAKYQNSNKEVSDRMRYRDWDNLKYWFRGVEKFAPWVNRIYFVTWGHIPLWLNTAHPKLTIVKHEDFIPKEYLPTFSSHPIELNLHRIAGLSHQFVYFNDDIFLTRPVKKQDFFKNGLPRDTCIESAVMQDKYEDSFAHILINDCALINMNFRKRHVIRNNFRKWFSPVYGSLVFRNVIMFPYRQFASFKFFHLASPFLKESFHKVWELEPDILDNVCRNKFRSACDVNQYVMKYYQFATGHFVPQNPGMGRFFIPSRDKEKIYEAVRKQKYKMICVNDDGDESGFEEMKRKLKESFSSILPEISSFETGAGHEI